MRNEEVGQYLTEDDKIVARAMEIVRLRFARQTTMNSPKVTAEFFALRSHALEHEVFSVAWLDSQHRVIDVTEISRGTLDQCAVYPREVVKLALATNAGAAIFHHNHPSGRPSPSRADEKLTADLKTALNLVGVRVLDHVITAGDQWHSMAEHGEI